MPFPNAAKASEYAPNVQCLQNTMRHSIFFLIQKCKRFEVQILTKGQVSGDDSTKAQWKQSMAMNYDVVLG